MEEKTYKLSDSVLARIVQVVQEAMLLGVDVVDIMRQIELYEADALNSPGQLALTPNYVEFVEKYHAKLVKELDKKLSETNAN